MKEEPTDEPSAPDLDEKELDEQLLDAVSGGGANYVCAACGSMPCQCGG